MRSSGTYRSTRFDLNFNAFPLFHLCHHRWHHKNVSANFNASISDAPAENSLRNDLSANVDTYELTIITYEQLPCHSWPPDALSIWPSSTLINSIAIQQASFEIFIRWHAHRSGYSRRIKTNSRWNHSAIKIRSIRVKQMNLELPWIIRNRQSWSCVGHYQR